MGRINRWIQEAFLPPTINKWRRIWEKRPEVVIMQIAKGLGRTKFQVWIITGVLASVMLYLGKIGPEIWAALIGGTGGLYQVMEGLADVKSRANKNDSNDTVVNGLLKD